MIVWRNAVKVDWRRVLSTLIASFAIRSTISLVYGFPWSHDCLDAGLDGSTGYRNRGDPQPQTTACAFPQMRRHRCGYKRSATAVADDQCVNCPASQPNIRASNKTPMTPAGSSRDSRTRRRQASRTCKSNANSDGAAPV